MGDTKQIQAQPPIVKSPYLSNRMIGGMIAGLAAFTFSGGFVAGYFAKRSMVETIRVEHKSLAPRYRAVDVLYGSRDFNTLKEKWSLISSHIRDVARYDGGQGLEDLHSTVYLRMLVIGQNTNVSNPFHSDDLDMLLRLPRKTKEDRLAMVFLALPRLAERGLPHHNDSADSKERATESEARFMRQLRKEIPEAADLLERYWYKENRALPGPGEETKFFQEFTRLFPSGQVI